MPPSSRPALLASASMNGALFDSTFNVFFRLKYEKLYDAALATPMRAGDVALGEISWALLRGGLYAVAFLVVMAAMGLVHSWWALAALPAAVLTGFAFAAGGMAGHHLHARLAGLRVRHAGDAADVPVLDHVLPAGRLPPAAADRGGVHAAVPEREDAARISRWARSARPSSGTPPTWPSWASSACSWRAAGSASCCSANYAAGLGPRAGG